MVHEVREVVDQLDQAQKLPVEGGQYMTHAGEHLQHVADADEPVVAGIRGQLVLVHHIHAGRGDRKIVAEKRFQTQAKERARLLAHGAGFKAAAVEVSLAALVLGEIALQDLVAQSNLRW